MKTNITGNHSTQSDNESTTQLLLKEGSELPASIIEWISRYQNEIIVVYNENKQAIYVSSSIERLLGYRPEEIVGSYWDERLLPMEKRYIDSNYKEIVNKIQNFTIYLVHKSGKKLTAECRVCKLVDNEKEYYVSIIKDIHEKKEIDLMLVKSEKMSVAGQLAAGIAHEIRNPLTSIKGFLQLLQAGVDRKEEYYKIMIEEIEKMEKITSELLYISKPLTSQKQYVPINDMITDIVSLLETQARLKNITINIEEPITEVIYCDKSQIKQVLINLVKNAIEAMDDSGVVTISVGTTERNININISDTGPGIPEEIIHKLGEPFFTTKKNGTGLGIMISKQIMHEHCGDLEILDNKPKGSIFKLNFPKQWQ